MSDRDVRKLAEEIRQVVEQDWTGHSEHDARLIADRILAFQSQRESDLRTQLHRALGEGARLRGEIAQLEAWRVSETSARISDVTEPSHGALSVLEELEVRLRAALSASPLSERAGAVLKAAERFRDSALTAGRNVLAGSDAELHSARVTLAEAHEYLVDSVDALRAELQKGGKVG